MAKDQIQNFLWYIGQFCIKNLIPLITLPVFTRYISVEDFGLYALAMIYGTILAGIANLGLSSIFERTFFELSPTKRKNLLFTILSFVMLLFLFLFCFTILFDELISETLFKTKALKDYLVLTISFQTFKSLNIYFLSYLKNYENAKTHTFLSVVESILSIGLALWFVTQLSMGLYGFILGQSIGVLLTFAITFVYLFFPFNSRFEIHMLKEQLHLSLPLTPKIFFGVINSQFDRYMLGLLGAIGGVGLYDIGQKIANTSFAFMTALQNVYAPQVYKRLFSESLTFRNSVGSYLTPFLYLSVFLCLPISLFSYEILCILTPKEFHAAAPVTSVLSLLYAFYFFGKQPQLLFAKKTGLISMLSLISIGLNIIFNIPMISYFGIMGAAWATLIAGTISTSISLYFGQKYTHIRYESKMFFILAYFILAAICTFILDSLIVPYSFKLALKIALFIGYILAGYNLNILSKGFILKLFNTHNK